MLIFHTPQFSFSSGHFSPMSVRTFCFFQYEFPFVIFSSTGRSGIERRELSVDATTGGAFEIGRGTTDFDWLHRSFSLPIRQAKRNDRFRSFTMYIGELFFIGSGGSQPPCCVHPSRHHSLCMPIFLHSAGHRITPI